MEQCIRNIEHMYSLNPNDHASQTLINRINKLKKKIIIQLGQAFGKYKLTIKDTIIMNIIKTC